MEAAVGHARALGFARLVLEVDGGATSALALYRGLGFMMVSKNERTLTMHLGLRKGRA